MLHKMGKKIYPCFHCGNDVIEDEMYAGVVMCDRCIKMQMEDEDLNDRPDKSALTDEDIEARYEPSETEEWHDYDPDC